MGEPRTAGLLPRPVWLIVRPEEDREHPRALGPIRTLEKLNGVAEGISWSSCEGDEIEGIVEAVPEDCKEIGVDDSDFPELATKTFERRLMEVLWYDFREGCWDPEKEWNADRWQDVGLVLEEFGIECPGPEVLGPADEEP
jgi:hypothetical protein